MESWLEKLAQTLRQSRGFKHKQDISSVLPDLLKNSYQNPNIQVGDDCAVLPQPGLGYTLLACEGFLSDFVASQPWFAGYCGIMVNVSDVAAMGGRPCAVVDALWSNDTHVAREIIKGMAAASTAYKVPIVGGHTNTRAKDQNLSVAILGQCKQLLTSFDACPKDKIVVAIDLQGKYREPYPFFDASTHSSSDELCRKIEILAIIAEAGLCKAAKDISMAGILGTILMLLECSEVGATVDPKKIPKPPEVSLERWLETFPSYGYILSVSEKNLSEVKKLFEDQNIVCEEIGEITNTSQLRLESKQQSALLWDFTTTEFMGIKEKGI